MDAEIERHRSSSQQIYIEIRTGFRSRKHLFLYYVVYSHTRRDHIHSLQGGFPMS
jgi:hypothetical protein